MSVKLERGWITTPYAGHDRSRVDMAVGAREPGEWQPAYLDYDAGERVAKIRPPGETGRVRVWLRVDAATTMVGRLVL